MGKLAHSGGRLALPGPQGDPGEIQYQHLSPWWQSGYWMDSRRLIPCGPTKAAKTLPVDQIWAQPLVVGIPTTIDAWAITVDTAAVGGVVSCALARFDATTQTLEIVHQLGTTDVSTTGGKTVAITPLEIDAGFWWLVLGTPTPVVQLNSFTDIYGGLFFLYGTAIGAGHFIALKHNTPYPFAGTYSGFPSAFNSGTLFTAALRKA